MLPSIPINKITELRSNSSLRQTSVSRLAAEITVVANSPDSIYRASLKLRAKSRVNGATASSVIDRQRLSIAWSVSQANDDTSPLDGQAIRVSFFISQQIGLYASILRKKHAF